VARPGPRGTVWPRAMEGPELPEVRSPVRAGQVVDRKYRVDGVLGAGGMGIVVSAMHLALDEPVALKFMTHADGRGDATSRARFLREAKAARKLTSAHVARVFDVGQLPSGEPYIVMELLKGDDLARHLRVHGRLSAADTVKYVLQVCDAIREAHALGIIHRDLKPQNLFLTERPGSNPIIKVLDFGIAKSLETTAPDGALTASQGVVGSPVYMSPEQLRASKHVDERTDIWSLGVIMFELLSGKVPFVGDSVVELGMRIMTVPAPSLIELRAELPAGLADIVQRCLEKEPEKRFQTIDTLAGALKAYAEVSLRSLPASDVSHRSLPFADTLNEPSTKAVLADAIRTGGEFAQTKGGTTTVSTRARRTWVAVGLLAVAIVAVALLQRRDAPMDPAHAPVATATQVQVFHVDVRVDPPSASVRFDSEGASSTPFARDVPRDGRAHTLAIEADGYAPMEISFRDVPPPASVTLKPLPASPAPAPSASPPTPTSAPRHAVAPKASAAPSATPAPTQPPTTTNDSPIVR
jgi:serine/threonine protein kinase